jgi:nuclear inhibitor of protein phosphatase 1
MELKILRQFISKVLFAALKTMADINTSLSGIPASPSGNNPLLFSSALASRLGLALPNPAPEVDMAPAPLPPSVVPGHGPLAAAAAELTHEPKKKKYAKEAWPGKKLMPTLLV